MTEKDKAQTLHILQQSIY